LFFIICTFYLHLCALTTVQGPSKASKESQDNHTSGEVQPNKPTREPTRDWYIPIKKESQAKEHQTREELRREAPSSEAQCRDRSRETSPTRCTPTQTKHEDNCDSSAIDLDRPNSPTNIPHLNTAEGSNCTHTNNQLNNAHSAAQQYFPRTNNNHYVLKHNPLFADHPQNTTNVPVVKQVLNKPRHEPLPHIWSQVTPHPKYPVQEPPRAELLMYLRRSQLPKPLPPHATPSHQTPPPPKPKRANDYTGEFKREFCVLLSKHPEVRSQWERFWRR
jgi:hypothetical protein